MTYDEWIEDFVSKVRFRTADGKAYLRGLCEHASAKMVEAFPELTRVRGHVGPTPSWQDEPHWWCVTATGEIIDPTKAQFTWAEIHYAPFDEKLAASLPTGKCHDCGGRLYYNADYCNERCAARTAAYLGMSMSANYRYNPEPDDPERPMYYD